jgi:hypothetical protein
VADAESEEICYYDLKDEEKEQRKLNLSLKK